VGSMYDDLRSDEHLVASMGGQLEDQHRKISALVARQKQAERQVRAEEARLAADEQRLNALRAELQMAQLHLRSANESFVVGARTLSRDELSKLADAWLAEARSLDARLPDRRKSLATLRDGQQVLENQVSEARQTWRNRVRDLESQVARLENAETQLAMVEVLREAKTNDSIFQDQYGADQNRLEQRIDVALSQADFLIDGQTTRSELIFHCSPDAVADRIGGFLDPTPAEKLVTSE
ncbi:MAG: hypothetical protein KDA59_26315, partial [Planctomycetales bacterium]|nr:hypothetical protein [Planctomycetales bacterium]